MKDLIDLGIRVFNQLKEKYGETEESRLLFLYGLTNGTKWNIIDSKHWILIEENGITKNFSDGDLDKLNDEWLSLKAKVDYDSLINKLNILRKEYDRSAPKDGDFWEFCNKPTPFININFKL